MGEVFDTSGEVFDVNPLADGSHAFWTWEHLTPFQRGYVEALLHHAHDYLGLRAGRYAPLGFSDLSPEALAMILADCEAFSRAIGKDPSHNAGLGRRFYENRQSRFSSLWSLHQAEFNAAFPPLRVFLSDDGKIHLQPEEAGR